MLQKGNLQKVHSLPVLGKIRSEALAQNDLTVDPLADLIKKAMAEKENVNTALFYQKVVAVPLSVIIFLDKSLHVLRKAQKEGKIIVLMQLGCSWRNT